MQSQIKIRDPKISDEFFMKSIENKIENKIYTNSPIFYSNSDIKKFINKKQDIFIDFQYRFTIDFENKPVGFLDLFDFDIVNSRVGLGIIIEKKYRRKGIAYFALEKIKEIILSKYQINQVYAEIREDNFESIKLFEKSKFKKNGIKKEWIRNENSYLDLYFYQFFF